MENNQVFEIDGILLRSMIRNGAYKLQKNVDKINALNVFPVPDGDTGTNMNLTFTSGVKEIDSLSSDNLSDVTKALSKGLLMGARGNSGVILSQLFRGFSKHVEGMEKLNAFEFAGALHAGVEMAYKAIMKPVEGTILTVSKDAANKALEKRDEKNLILLMEHVLKEAKESLKRTKEILPILKQVGVVDSGGQGLVNVYEGMLAALKGEQEYDWSKDDSNEIYTVSDNKQEHVEDEIAQMMNQGVLSVNDIEFGYCTEFMILRNPDAPTYNEYLFKEKLSQYGDSLLVISDDDFIKIHIHAEKLDEILLITQQYGELTKIKIENMREQFRNRSNSVIKERKSCGIIAIGAGEGIKELFNSMGTDYFILGGQTMNPSTEDIAKAIKEVNADHVIVLPNNSNIIMAANQAAELSEESVHVIPSKTIQQGLSALMQFDSTRNLEDNLAGMNANLKTVKSGQVTRAVRNTEIDGITIKENDFMGMLDGKILTTHEELDKTLKDLFEKIIDENDEIVTLIYGEDVSKEDAEQVEEMISATLEKLNGDVEIELVYGGQPLYPYLISIE